MTMVNPTLLTSVPDVFAPANHMVFRSRTCGELGEKRNEETSKDKHQMPVGFNGYCLVPRRN